VDGVYHSMSKIGTFDEDSGAGVRVWGYNPGGCATRSGWRLLAHQGRDDSCARAICRDAVVMAQCGPEHPHADVRAVHRPARTRAVHSRCDVILTSLSL
jgi:hypothetical protein